MNAENAIESHYRKLSDILNNEFEDLYEPINNDKLRILFSTLHSSITSLFDSMNNRLPTDEDSAHFWAEPSRELIRSIETIEALERSLKNSEYAFYIEEYHRDKLNFCKSFLSKSGGSAIPPYTEKLELYYTIPIFFPQSSIKIENKNNTADLKALGSGSYANVYKYFDSFYLKNFALKRAKKDLNAKEIQRFRREYEQMSMLSSPYVLEVYGYNEKNNEYIMEFMDNSLDKYILKNNSKLSFHDRVKLGLQILKAFSYIHSKNILHRDISPKNILLKEYDDVVVVKVADFGLVKIVDSELTSCNTNFKGYYNDPSLVTEGFDNYSILHETYALTRILYYVLTGKSKTEKPPENVSAFIYKGLSSDKTVRFKNIDELRKAFQAIAPI
ncbi:protein kinase family protein [Ectopseudomonas toyotomiensis]|uniref:mitogen-activated protein kinase kinase n=1 Tax=Ectopseudomonas toyotomiensis TaxID=554344 RepID=A0ABD7E0Y9_9GAMM|nr:MULTISPECIES: protein kinase family protein [Pseudomonas]QSL94408.1 protein kinase family protein [Pseudomonas toyotomiensis]RRV22614.1 protein kinase family protein [Pseudomonas sp. o96-267]